MSEADNPDALDEASVRRAFDRAAAHYERADALQREVADELLERLACVRVTPRRIVDLGCGTGYALGQLQHMYRRAEVFGIDFAPAMAAQARAGRRLRRRPLGICADVRRTPLPDHSVDVVLSNLTLQWISDPRVFFTEVRRILRPEGVLMFSTFGPDTLAELRQAWAAVDHEVHINTFLDMHDIGDAALAAGLSEPVMDVDRWRRAYPDVRALMRSIKAMGAHNAT
ncbi:MAG: malonyl-[acyl-carrier protein] O-methyltransferase BioC, partial [Proteobacteria bacterium SW_6_67_9]